MQTGCSASRQRCNLGDGTNRSCRASSRWPRLLVVASLGPGAVLGAKSPRSFYAPQPGPGNLASGPQKPSLPGSGGFFQLASQLMADRQGKASTTGEEPVESEAGTTATQSGGGDRKSTGFNSFVAGGLAGSISTTLTSPVEVSFMGKWSAQASTTSTMRLPDVSGVGNCVMIRAYGPPWSGPGSPGRHESLF